LITIAVAHVIIVFIVLVHFIIVE